MANLPGFLRFAQENGANVLRIEGIITADEWGWWYQAMAIAAITPSSMRDQLASLGGADLTLIIDSPGGDCDAGAAIYTALMEYPGRITVQIPGRAHSYASLLAMTGDRRIMSPAAKMMLHNPYGDIGTCDYRDADSAYQGLLNERDIMAALYAEATGQSVEAICDMMDATTWLDAQSALDRGFIHEVQDFQASQAFQETAPAQEAPPIAHAQGLRQVFALERAACMRRLEARQAPTPQPPQDSLERAAIAERCRLMVADLLND